MHEIDEHFMQIALRLARRGRGAVEPNPTVGAVIVRDGKILGEGWHEQFGGPHAEVNAIMAAGKNGHDTRGATMYVTLEPCSHFGKTPPCIQAVIKGQFARVIVAMQDPDEKVSGRGLAQLQEAGIEVATDVCNDDARELLAAYIKLRTKQRPWVICKWAQTSDGYLALPADQDRWISSPESRMKVHELRTLCDGLLVGVGTVLADDPLLTARNVDIKRHPTRVVLDSSLKTPAKSKLIRSIGDAPIIIATSQQGITENPKRTDALRKTGTEILELPCTADGIDLAALLDELGRRDWTHLLVEAGPRVLESFIQNQLADELHAYVAPIHTKPKANLPHFDINDVLHDGKYVQTAEESVGADSLHVLRLKA
ncbi:MAG: bifunctional diaminohydroxyphosphoribosylaminopyrimidine deaminase/5-amino-6-(5-phosphoribosylamino)uracil reductase RibD [Phycisphaerae bacterium]|nr:bifunctional diaminohydroxyphosphoribosylaminopyrimidine deaminase/5-amino-6-(5-phosphoribosylamino)uracil reductase RibD [Phycisphaerae bacterium]